MTNKRVQLYDLQGNPVDGRRPIELLAGASAPQPNQSYLAKQMQYRLAACICNIVNDLSGLTISIPGPWHQPWNSVVEPNDWRKNHQRFELKGWPSKKDGRWGWGAYVQFSNARWDPDHSKINYGRKRAAQDAVVSSAGKTRLIQNDTDGPLHVHYSESESLTNSYSTSVTQGVTLDLTVTSETTVSGSYGGVDAEEKLTTEFGVSTSKEETHDKATEGTSDSALEIEFDAEPGEYYLITITKEHATTYQDFRIDGIMDFDIEIGFGEGHDPVGRQDKYYPGSPVKVVGIDGFRQFIYGFDTSAPKIHGYYPKHAWARVQNAVNRILDPAMRHIEVSGTNQASLESNADYHVEPLGKTLPGHLAHLPVEKAGDLADGGVKLMSDNRLIHYVPVSEQRYAEIVQYLKQHPARNQWSHADRLSLAAKLTALVESEHNLGPRDQTIPMAVDLLREVVGWLPGGVGFNPHELRELIESYVQPV